MTSGRRRHGRGADNAGRIRARRGTGTIEERHGSWWWRRSGTDTAGRRHTWREGPFATQAAAQSAQAAGQPLDAIALATRDLTWGDWLTAWLDRYLTELHAEERHSYAGSLRRSVQLHLIPRIGGIRLTDHDAAMWKRLWRDLLGDGYKRATVQNIRGGASLASKAAVAEGLTTTDYVAVAPIPRPRLSDIEAEHRHAILTPDEAAELARLCLDGALGRWSLPALVALDTGARRGEVLGLQWDDIDPERRTLHIRRQVIEESSTPGQRLGLPKGGRPRRLILPVRTVQALVEARPPGAGEPDPIFRGRERRGGVLPSPDAWTDAWGRRLRRDHPVIAGTTPHDLRHTHASLLLREGVSPVAVAARLGHADVSTTLRRYAHAIPLDDGLVADAWAALTEVESGR